MCQATIMSSNVPSINLTFSGELSFEGGEYISDIGDTQININCIGESSCKSAKFYYYNTGNTNHLCDGTESCADSMIECGVDNKYKCKLICNGYDSCNSKIFMLTNNIKLECNSFQSCLSMHIVSIDMIVAMNLMLNGVNSFSNGKFLGNISDGTINTYCNGNYSCYNSKFYYFGIHSNLHSCTKNQSCSLSSIYAFNSIHLECNGYDHISCQEMDIFLPTNIDELQNELSFEGTRNEPIRIYSIFGINSHTSIYCLECALENIWVIYGLPLIKHVKFPMIVLIHFQLMMKTVTK